MRGRSLLWAGPGVMLLGGGGPGAEPLAAGPLDAESENADPAEPAIAAAEDVLVPLPARGPAAAAPAARDAASYAGSSVAKTKG